MPHRGTEKFFGRMRGNFGGKESKFGRIFPFLGEEHKKTTEEFAFSSVAWYEPCEETLYYSE